MEILPNPLSPSSLINYMKIKPASLGYSPKISPEKRLLFAILNRAVLDAIGGGPSGGFQESKIKKEAFEWITGRTSSPAVTYDYCTEILDIDKDALRERVLKARMGVRETGERLNVKQGDHI